MNCIYYEPLAGTHVAKAIDYTRRLAKTLRRPVRFVFNGRVIIATRKRSAASMLWEWELVGAQQHATYRKSKRFAAELERRRMELLHRQAEVDRLMALLRGSVSRGLRDTVSWLSRFSEIADDNGLRYDISAIIATLEAAGYGVNQHVGRPQEDYADATVMGEYIVGQAIECMRRGMPPHPITSKFAAEYEKLLVREKQYGISQCPKPAG